MHNVTLRRVRVSTVAVAKAVSTTYSEGVSVAMVIQHALRMRHILIVACPAVTYFSTISLTARFSDKSY
jgi:hypothetical protein